MKPRQIIFVADADFEPTNPELTQRVAEHFVQWMSNPPVVFFTSTNGLLNNEYPSLNQLAGTLEQTDLEAMTMGLPKLVTAMEASNLWELAPNKPTS